MKILNNGLSFALGALALLVGAGEVGRRGLGGSRATRRYPTQKKPGDPGYSPEWSGVTGAPRSRGLSCKRCGGSVHKEGVSYYCPSCDDYVAVQPK